MPAVFPQRLNGTQWIDRSFHSTIKMVRKFLMLSILPAEPLSQFSRSGKITGSCASCTTWQLVECWHWVGRPRIRTWQHTSGSIVVVETSMGRSCISVPCTWYIYAGVSRPVPWMLCRVALLFRAQALARTAWLKVELHAQWIDLNGAAASRHGHTRLSRQHELCGWPSASTMPQLQGKQKTRPQIHSESSLILVAKHPQMGALMLHFTHTVKQRRNSHKQKLRKSNLLLLIVVSICRRLCEFNKTISWPENAS